MAFYTPIAPPTPRIIVTDHADNINTVHVPWNRNLLAALWISQLLFLLFGLAVLPYEFYGIISIQEILIGIMALGNVVLMSTPLIEAHHYATGNLAPQFFHKLQGYKAKWVAGSLVVIVLTQAGNKYKSVWGVLWAIVADVLYSLPFVAGMLYAKEMLKEPIASKDGAEDVESGSVRLG
ncbi:hypothetical protein ONS95_011914 [Cadophora gregata]|uniref:uncharacterized protein n=1 Tax=Cadophora gregata TaxID=51156 RepID=UPI0026DB21E8|nr:uncharacterized protein ONS95_011914 [Cadophora gregata]KAK0117579.1 hypothetical protein ONS95_011914 [Cadophora gregata]